MRFTILYFSNNISTDTGCIKLLYKYEKIQKYDGVFYNTFNFFFLLSSNFNIAYNFYNIIS